MDPFSLDSTGFLNLLASQSSQAIEVGSSEVPRFSSQSLGEIASKERRKWTTKDDVVLISAWLNTSKDPIVGNEQKALAFWKRISEYFNSSTHGSGQNGREASTCKQRWGRVNDQVCKWVGCYEAAMRHQSSGQNDNDVMKGAHEIFQNDHKTKFTLEHAWRELRNDQKWSSLCLAKDGGNEKRKNVVELDGPEEVTEGRPPGVKACKAAKRSKNGNEAAMEQLQKMLDMKDKLSNKKLLERLLAKEKETLSEQEVLLKNKLIAEFL